MRASFVVLSTNIPLRRDGIPYAGQAQPQDPGVSIYFVRNGKRLVIACDCWDRVEDNLHSINLSVGAMRGLERWGCSDILDRAFTGFAALPPPEQKSNWWDVLGVDPRDSLAFIETSYRNRARYAHPDAGGSTDKMARINCAIEEARAAKGGAA